MLAAMRRCNLPLLIVLAGVWASCSGQPAPSPQPAPTVVSSAKDLAAALANVRTPNIYMNGKHAM